MFKSILHDVTFGIRLLRKSPGFTIVAVVGIVPDVKQN